jgi:hypothetical protein
VTIGHQRHTKLGSFIADVCRKFDVLCPSSNGVMGDEISYHHVIASCPRGKFRILGTDPVTIMFVSALCRGLHLVDSMAAFHPFSQVTSSTHINKLHTVNVVFQHPVALSQVFFI